MNTILLQKILDILREGLAHVGDFFKDLFISDPQDGQVIAYDAESGHWVNKDATEVELDLTNTFEAQAIATITDGAENVPMKSLVCEIVNVTGGTDTVVITHTGKNLFNKATATDGKVVNNQGQVVDRASITLSDYIRVIPNTNYYITNVLGSSSYYSSAVYDMDKKFIANVNVSGSGNVSGVVTIPANAYYIRINFTKANKDEAMFSIGTTATDYEPYTANNHTVTLSASVENGYIDIVSGHGKDTDNDIDITCTPTTIKIQGGTESIFADTGDVSGEYYTKTAESVLALANITEDITATITKNTTDFSDILLKVSRNNKVVSVEIYSATTAAAVNDTFLSNLPKPAMNCKVLLVNTTLGEDGTILGTLKTSGELEIATSGAKSFSGLITYVAK